MKKIFSTMMIVVLLLTSSCGTILYPERRGQASGKIDIGVALLDGIGILLFFVPGIVAFAVDFATGAIYLPPGEDYSNLNAIPAGKKIMVADIPLTQENLKQILLEQTGRQVDLNGEKIMVARLSSEQKPEWQAIDQILTAEQLAAFRHCLVKSEK